LWVNQPPRAAACGKQSTCHGEVASQRAFRAERGADFRNQFPGREIFASRKFGRLRTACAAAPVARL